MLSRLAVSRAAAPLILVRGITTSHAALMPFKEGPERDLVNFPRPKRLEHPPPVRFGFIPDDWFTFFYKKTGLTGPYVFGTGLVTFLLSKEIWVTEHEFWNGLALVVLITMVYKKFGPALSDYLEKEQDKHAEELNAGRVNEIQSLHDAIAAERKAQWQIEGGDMIFDVKRENIALQVEASYRERIMQVYSEVKKRLDYHAEKQDIERNLLQKHMASWIVARVKSSITPEQEQENIKKCIADLKKLAAA